MPSTPSHSPNNRSSRSGSADTADVWPPAAARRRDNYVDQHYEPWPSDPRRYPAGTPINSLDVDSSRANSPVRAPRREDNTRSSEVSSPSSVYTAESQTGSGFRVDGRSRYDDFPTPGVRGTSELRRSRSGPIVVEEETASPFSMEENERVFSPASESQASAPMSGPPRPPDTGIDFGYSPSGGGARKGIGNRYDEAPTPGIYRERRRSSSVNGGQSGGPVDSRHTARQDRASCFARMPEVSPGVFDRRESRGRPAQPNDPDYFSFKGPSVRFGNTVYEEVSPRTVPAEGQVAAYLQPPSGRDEHWGLARNNSPASASVGRDSSLHKSSVSSSITLVPPVDEGKSSDGDSKNNSLGGVWPFNRKSKDAAGESPPGRSKHAYREKVQKMRNGENPRPSGKRLTTTSAKREKFVMRLAKALLAFGAPSHRIESQLQAASHVLRLDARFVHFPNMIMCTFQGHSGNTIEIHFVRASGRVALTSLHKVHQVYRDVLHDRISTEEGTKKLDEILHAKPLYSIYLRCLLAFTCASIICVLAFGGSLLDMFLAGAAASVLQFLGLRAAAKSSVYANVYEISVSIIVSFAARGFGTIPNQLFCFSAISSGGVVLVLPGFTVLVSALELTAQNVMCGSVRMVYAVIYTLFLGFGLTIGSELFLVIVPQARKAQDLTTLLESHAYHGYLLNNNASMSVAQTAGIWSFTDISQAQSRVIKGCYRDPTWPWWRQPFPWWTMFFLVPIYSFCSSLANLQAIKSAQMAAMVAFSCAAYAANRGANRVFSDRPEMVSAVGSVVIGVCGNIWSRLGGGTAFTVMVTGVLFLVPSALGNGGGLIGNYNSSSQEYSNSFDLGVRMIEVGIGVTLGLFLAAMLVYSWGGRKSAGHFGF